MKQPYTVDQVRTIVRDIAARHGVARVYLFGSYARGDATPDSDLDLRIDQGEITDLFMLGGLYADLEDALEVPVDLLTTRSLEPSFLQSIAPEEVLLYDCGQP